MILQFLLIYSMHTRNKYRKGNLTKRKRRGGMYKYTSPYKRQRLNPPEIQTPIGRPAPLLFGPAKTPTSVRPSLGAAEEHESCSLSLPSYVDLSGKRSVTLWINTHGADTSTPLKEDLPICSAVGQKVGYVSTLTPSVALNLQRLKSLKRLYVRDFFSANQEVNAAFKDISKFAVVKKQVSQEEYDGWDHNYLRLYSHDRIFSIRGKTPDLHHSNTLGIFVLGTNLKEGDPIRDLLETPYETTNWSLTKVDYESTIPELYRKDIYHPALKTATLPEYLDYQKWNLLNIDYYNQLITSKYKPTELDKNDLIVRRSQIKLSTVLLLFKELKFEHVNVIDMGCRGMHHEHPDRPPEIHRSISDAEKDKYEGMTRR